MRLGCRPLERVTERMRESSADVSLVHPGTALHFPEKTVEGGIPGSPAVSLVFVDSAGQAIGPDSPIETSRLGWH